MRTTDVITGAEGWAVNAIGVAEVDVVATNFCDDWKMKVGCVGTRAIDADGSNQEEIQRPGIEGPMAVASCHADHKYFAKWSSLG